MPLQVTRDQLFAARAEVLQLHMAPAVEDYLVQLVLATREPAPYAPELARWVSFGASPRATIALDRCARAHAWLQGRDYVSPDDVQAIAPDVLRHRVLISFEAEAEGRHARAGGVDPAGPGAGGLSMAAVSHSPLFAARGADVAHDPALTVSARDLIELAGAAAALQPLQTLAARARRAGGHLSLRRGRGMDYEESRAYQAGDDIRAMDWRVTARAGEPHTKLFREERERPVVLCLDLNPGMFFASRGALKSVQAARAAALFGWAAVTQGDRVGALLFNQGHHELRPRPGRQGILRLVRELVVHTDPGAALTGAPAAGGLNAALLRLRRLVRPGSLVILISDFYGLNPDSTQHLLFLRRHNDLVALQVLDPLETGAPPAGRYSVTDGRERRQLDAVSARDRRQYEHVLAAQHEGVKRLLQGCRRRPAQALDRGRRGRGAGGAVERPVGALARPERRAASGMMASSTEPALALRDIHLPAPPPWWPPAPGWWLLALAVLLLLALATWWLVAAGACAAGAGRSRLLLLQLEQATDAGPALPSVWRAFPNCSNGWPCSATLAVEVAALSGDAWLTFLDRTGGDGAFIVGTGSGARRWRLPAADLADGIDVPGLMRAVRLWVRRNTGGYTTGVYR